jgi:hypothetical protein
MLKKTLLASLVGLTCLTAQAEIITNELTEILPVSYSFNQNTSSGSYNYSDWTGSQLTDGMYGGDSWSMDLGYGKAYEWLGWLNKPTVNIDFAFEQTTKLNQIDIGTVQDHLNDVVLPSVRLYESVDGYTWTLLDEKLVPESTDNNYKHSTISLNNFTANTNFIRVSLDLSLDGPWTFSDEIDFYQIDSGELGTMSYSVESTQVPLPATAALLAVGLLGFSSRLKQK